MLQFANILNNKILKENYNIALTSEELLTIKKYLIITTLRVKDNNMEHEEGVLSANSFIIVLDTEETAQMAEYMENIIRRSATKYDQL